MSLMTLFWGLAVGTTAAGFTVALRALPLVERRVMARRKPWACDICMGFWTTAVVTALLVLWQRDWDLVASAGPAYPVALWTLRKLTDPLGPPPSMPPLEEDS